MSYSITRFENVKGKYFLNMEITDDLGVYNFAKWLNPKEAARYQGNSSKLEELAESLSPSANSSNLEELEELAESLLPSARAQRTLQLEEESINRFNEEMMEQKVEEFLNIKMDPIILDKIQQWITDEVERLFNERFPS